MAAPSLGEIPREQLIVRAYDRDKTLRGKTSQHSSTRAARAENQRLVDYLERTPARNLSEIYADLEAKSARSSNMPDHKTAAELGGIATMAISLATYGLGGPIEALEYGAALGFFMTIGAPLFGAIGQGGVIEANQLGTAIQKLLTPEELAQAASP